MENNDENNDDYFMPLINCKQFDNRGEDKISYCVGEKFLDFFNFLMIILMIFTYFRSKGKYNLRQIIIIICIIKNTYVVIHYGFEPKNQRKNTFFIIEILRYIVMTLLCYYYCKKASGLLKNRKDIMCILKMFLAIGLFFMLVGAVYI